ncbi:UbiA family prenyltransferase [Halorussus caseinilyticus]|uniref:UbiA family prenyltransferase n=1 Tax=Halorussus caseinilyticus TaxID=3034025 RepID=A0ABD5WKE0_9EURY|nr:UbiA family prenyltransferase [Halorussus sp. DT72]
MSVVNNLALLAGGIGVGVLALLAHSVQATSSLLKRISKMVPCTFAYWAMIAFGMLFELKDGTFSTELLPLLGAAAVAVSFANWGQWLINDLYDKDTDKHSNQDRATTQNEISDRVTFYTGTSLSVFGCLFALVINVYALLSVLGFIVVFGAYSIRPIRLKSNAYTAMLSIGLLGGFCFLLGSATVVNQPSAFTLFIFALITLVMTINVSYKDIKDAEHDEKSDSENFVVKFGRDRVRRLLIVGLPISYFMFGLVFELYSWLPVFAVLALVVVYLLYDRDGKYHRLVYELDALNGVYLLMLGLGYYGVQLL